MHEKDPTKDVEKIIKVSTLIEMSLFSPKTASFLQKIVNFWWIWSQSILYVKLFFVDTSGIICLHRSKNRRAAFFLPFKTPLKPDYYKTISFFVTFMTLFKDYFWTIIFRVLAIFQACFWKFWRPRKDTYEPLKT